MECIAYREAISARIDGEDAGLETQAVDTHLAACPACRSWAEAAMAVTRTARVGPADQVPDLTAHIMAALTPARRRSAPVPARPTVASPVLVARIGLLLVAVAQLFVALPALLGNDAGATVHVAHEQGSWALALAVGLLLVAARPGRAAAMLPVVAALSTGLAFTMMIDIWAGRTQASAEAPHCLAFLGLGLLWLLTREFHSSSIVRARRATTPSTPSLA